MGRKKKTYVESLQDERKEFIELFNELENCQNNTTFRSEERWNVIYKILKRYLEENIGYIDTEIEMVGEEEKKRN